MKPPNFENIRGVKSGAPVKRFQMSSFFRNLYQFRAFRQVLSRIFENGSSRPIRIWVPGCSDGREAYSIAILIREAGYHLSREIDILATDIDPKVVMLAAQGIYRQLDERREAGVPADRDRNRELIAKYQPKYFRVVRGGLLAVKDEVKRMVRFRVDNLLQPSVEGRFDMVSCHNVLMHLPDVERHTAALTLLEKIEAGGFLVTNDAIFRVHNNLSRLPLEQNAYGYSAYQLTIK